MKHVSGRFVHPEEGRSLILFDGLEFLTDLDAASDYKNKLRILIEVKTPYDEKVSQKLLIQQYCKDFWMAGKASIGLLVDKEQKGDTHLRNLPVRKICINGHDWVDSVAHPHTKQVLDYWTGRVDLGKDVRKELEDYYHLNVKG